MTAHAATVSRLLTQAGLKRANDATLDNTGFRAVQFGENVLVAMVTKAPRTAETKVRNTLVRAGYTVRMAGLDYLVSKP